jgi:hypothetical protein
MAEPQQQQIAQYENIIDTDKFQKRLERYVHGTFAMSKSACDEIVEEVYDIAIGCIDRRPLADAEQQITDVITELERLKQEAQQEHNGAMDYGMRLNRSGRIDMAEVAISLLREVKK